MANVQEITKLESSYHFLGDFCEIKCIFKQESTNAPIHVYRPKFEIRKDNTVIGPSSQNILVPLSPTGIKEGEYRTSFLSKDFNIGIYELVFSGYSDEKVENSKIELKSKVEIFEVSGIQTLMTMLRRQLSDHLPSLYWIDDVESFSWEDADLYNALLMSVDAWNSTPPVSYDNNMATIDNFPYRNILLEGAEYYALNQKYLLENKNKLIYSDDTSFTIDRAPGIMQKIQVLINTWRTGLEKTKKDYTIRVLAQPKGIKSLRLPMRVLQSLSMTPQFSFLSSGY